MNPTSTEGGLQPVEVTEQEPAFLDELLPEDADLPTHICRCGITHLQPVEVTISPSAVQLWDAAMEHMIDMRSPSMPAAMAAAVEALRTNMEFRQEIHSAQAQSVIPASVLLEDGSVDIVYIPCGDLADQLRVVEAEEAARAAAAEALHGPPSTD